MPQACVGRPRQLEKRDLLNQVRAAPYGQGEPAIGRVLTCGKRPWAAGTGSSISLEPGDQPWLARCDSQCEPLRSACLASDSHYTVRRPCCAGSRHALRSRKYVAGQVREKPAALPRVLCSLRQHTSYLFTSVFVPWRCVLGAPGRGCAVRSRAGLEHQLGDQACAKRCAHMCQKSVIRLLMALPRVQGAQARRELPREGDVSRARLE